MKIRLVIATRLSEKDFFEKTATGRSISIRRPEFVEVRLFINNRLGLPILYNQAIFESIDNPAILIFIHDDIHVLDYYWFNKVIDALNNFQVIGLAGNKRRVKKQPSWAFIDDSFTWDQKDNLSGIIGHGDKFPPNNLSIYGEPRQKVKLLDGLLLAVNSKTLINNNIYFDEIFDFNFYDMDICRQAEIKKITCGTWDISVIHESGGNFGSEGWVLAYKKYLNKWID